MSPWLHCFHVGPLGRPDIVGHKRCWVDQCISGAVSHVAPPNYTHVNGTKQPPAPLPPPSPYEEQLDVEMNILTALPFCLSTLFDGNCTSNCSQALNTIFGDKSDDALCQASHQPFQAVLLRSLSVTAEVLFSLCPDREANRQLNCSTGISSNVSTGLPLLAPGHLNQNFGSLVQKKHLVEYHCYLKLGMLLVDFDHESEASFQARFYSAVSSISKVPGRINFSPQLQVRFSHADVVAGLRLNQTRAGTNKENEFMKEMLQLIFKSLLGDRVDRISEADQQVLLDDMLAAAFAGVGATQPKKTHEKYGFCGPHLELRFTLQTQGLQELAREIESSPLEFYRWLVRQYTGNSPVIVSQSKQRE
eukprot:g17045.t1